MLIQDRKYECEKTVKFLYFSGNFFHFQKNLLSFQSEPFYLEKGKKSTEQRNLTLKNVFFSKIWKKWKKIISMNFSLWNEIYFFFTFNGV
jgi:hypothetical protein